MNLPLLSHRFGYHSLPRDRRRRHRTRLLVRSFAAALGALAPTVPLPAADLVVQGTNSPYAFTTGTASYDNIYVGETASGTLNQSGGTLTAATGQLFLGADAGVTGTYNLSGGTLNTISTDVGDSGTAVFTLSGTGVHNVNGTDGTANGSLDLGYYSGGSGTYNLNGGTLTAGYVRGSAGTSVFNFNGGTLTAGTSATDFFQNLTHAYVGSGGANVNTNGYNVTAAQNLEHTNANGAAATDGGLTKLGAGTLTLTGTSTYTGATTINAGTLAVGSGGSVSGGNVIVGAGATLAISGTGSVSPGNSYTLNVDGTSASAASVTLSGTGSLSTGMAYVGISGTGSFMQSGGSFTTNGNNLNIGYNSGNSGSYTLSGTGSLSTSTAFIGYSGTGSFTQSGGSFTTNGNNLNIGNNSGSSGSYTLSGGTLTTGLTQVSDAANTSSFTQTGGTHTTGTLSLTGVSTGSRGTYNLNGGTLNAGTVTSGDGGTSGTSTFNFNGGTLVPAASSTSFLQGLTTANVQAGGAVINTNSFNVTVAQSLLHDTTAGAAAADGGLTKLGAGTLTLTGVNTFTGPLSIDAGTLAAAGEANLGAGSVVTVNGSGQLAFTASTTLTRTYNLGVSTLEAASGQTLTFGSGAVVSGGYLAGPGTDALGSGATLNGVTALVGTTLAQKDGGAATLNNVTVRGTLNQSSGTLALDNALVLGSGQVIVNGTVNAAGTEIQGVTTVNSGGTLATSGTSLYLTGGSRTTVNGGGTLAAASGTTVELNGSQLVNNGTQTGTLDVNYGSTAKGTGTFGTINVGDGGRFGVNASASGATGNGLVAFHLSGSGGLAQTAFVGPQLSVAPGTANVSSLTLGSGSVFAFNVQDAQGAAGSGYDTVHAGGALTLAAGTTAGNQITISLASLGSGGTAGPAANFDPSRNDTFVLVAAAGGISGYQAGEFTVDTTGFQNATNGGSFSVVPQGNNLDLVFTSAVPEPSTWVLVSVGVGVLALGLRRRACPARLTVQTALCRRSSLPPAS